MRSAAAWVSRAEFHPVRLGSPSGSVHAPTSAGEAPEPTTCSGHSLGLFRPITDATRTPPKAATASLLGFPNHRIRLQVCGRVETIETTAAEPQSQSHVMEVLRVEWQIECEAMPRRPSSRGLLHGGHVVLSAEGCRGAASRKSTTLRCRNPSRTGPSLDPFVNLYGACAQQPFQPTAS
jgi:hypothetical protein